MVMVMSLPMTRNATWLTDLRNDRVHLARHDGRAVLPRREIDLAEAGARPGRHETKVIGNFRERHRARFDSARHRHERVRVLRGVDEIARLCELHAGYLAQHGDDAPQVRFVRVDAGADGRAAHIERAHLVHGLAHAHGVAPHGVGIGAKLLSQPDRHGVLHLRAAHFDDVVKFRGICPQTRHAAGPARSPAFSEGAASSSFRRWE